MMENDRFSDACFDQESEELIEASEGILLIQKKNGLKFGTDALLLSSFVGDHGKGSRAIELGSGTGILSLLCLKRDQVAHITALEVQEQYAALTERNARLNHLEDRLTVICTDLRDHPRKEQADLILTNPPYMKTTSGKENTHPEKFIARHEARGTITDFCKCGSGMLKYGGFFYVVYRPDRLCDLLCAMREAGVEPKRIQFVARSPEHAPSLVMVEGKKGAAGGAILPKTIFTP